jgi:predicted membrane protein
MLRGASLIFATITSVVGLVFPYVLAQQATALNQSILLLMMAAISGAFIYGVGFQPRAKWVSLLISPFITWSVLALTTGSLLALRS